MSGNIRTNCFIAALSAVSFRESVDSGRLQLRIIAPLPSVAAGTAARRQAIGRREPPRHTCTQSELRAPTNLVLQHVRVADARERHDAPTIDRAPHAGRLFGTRTGALRCVVK